MVAKMKEGVVGNRSQYAKKTSKTFVPWTLVVCGSSLHVAVLVALHGRVCRLEGIQSGLKMRTLASLRVIRFCRRRVLLCIDWVVRLRSRFALWSRFTDR